MSDGGLDWDWHVTEFRKALINCAGVADEMDPEKGIAILSELYVCSLLMLNFRHRLSPKQQADLSRLARACGVDDPEQELRGDPEWDIDFVRNFNEVAFADGIKRARKIIPLLVDL